MKRSTAIRHLREMASEATERLQLRGTTIGWPLEELWVSGAFLSDVAALDIVSPTPEEFAAQVDRDLERARSPLEDHGHLRGHSRSSSS